MTELWTIHDALSMVWLLGFCHVKFETDNLKVSRIVIGVSEALVDNSLVIAIWNLLSYNWEVEVRHIGRSTNGVADFLARMYRGAPIDNDMFAKPPLEAEVEVRHIGRSANGVADFLTRMYRGAPIGNDTFAEPPLKAVAAMLHDLHCL
ncbi:hypothetical protein V6N11_055884 [Hibiscus sabdariffa]|uniref:RNase H type-1 domain-containing protein n=1 Tax=Hibiscus sabdariffa TaxID=183260 RepID=A0ABR2T283_9ROSI